MSLATIQHDYDQSLERAGIWSGTLGRGRFALGFLVVLAACFLTFVVASSVNDAGVALCIGASSAICLYLYLSSIVIRRARHAGQMWLAWATLIPIPMPLVRWLFIGALLLLPEQTAKSHQ
jgi:hypothetical protein